MDEEYMLAYLELRKAILMAQKQVLFMYTLEGDEETKNRLKAMSMLLHADTVSMPKNYPKTALQVQSGNGDAFRLEFKHGQ